MTLADAIGTWSGSNGFRLMPGDPLVDLPATVTVTTAAGGHLTVLAYAWEHPDDGAQDGLLVVSSAGDDGSPVAVWADSWHQKPATMTLPGGVQPDGTVVFEADYGGGWRWRILLDATDPGTLRMRMDNVIPADQGTPQEPAGPYPVMVMQTHRG